MSQSVIYLKLKPFIRQYLVHAFGDPVRFDDHSVTNARIISVLQRRPGASCPEPPADDLTAVCIPYSKQKDPASFNFVSSSGKNLIIEHIEAIFLMNLWNEMSQMCGDDTKLQTAAYAWCEMHGIDLDYADTIRMRYYREKKKLLEHGIDLRSKKRIHK
jgi:hypothetical protein